jgi:hypothetical protein
MLPELCDRCFAHVPISLMCAAAEARNFKLHAFEGKAKHKHYVPLSSKSVGIEGPT